MKILPVKSKVSGLFAAHEPIHRAVDLIGHESGEANIRKREMLVKGHTYSIFMGDLGVVVTRLMVTTSEGQILKLVSRKMTG